MKPALFAIAFLLVAGCLDGNAQAYAETTTDEMAGADAAKEAAEAWHPEALLAMVTGTENRVPLEEDGLVPHIDPDVGDGRAQRWLHLFVTPNANLAVITESSHVVAVDPVDGSGSTLKSPIEWKLSATDAVKALRKNTTMDQVLDRSNIVDLSLGNYGSSFTLWRVEASEREHEEGIAAYVDANTGAVVDPFGPGKWENGTQAGAIRPTSTLNSLPFQLSDSGHPQLQIVVEPTGLFWYEGSRATWIEVISPAGLKTNETWKDMSCPYHLSLPSPMAGDWTVTIQAGQLAYYDFELTWTAPDRTHLVRVDTNC